MVWVSGWNSCVRLRSLWFLFCSFVSCRLDIPSWLLPILHSSFRNARASLAIIILKCLFPFSPVFVRLSLIITTISSIALLPSQQHHIPFIRALSTPLSHIFKSGCCIYTPAYTLQHTATSTFLLAFLLLYVLPVSGLRIPPAPTLVDRTYLRSLHLFCLFAVFILTI